MKIRNYHMGPRSMSLMVLELGIMNLYVTNLKTEDIGFYNTLMDIEPLACSCQLRELMVP